jgi:hypothetical protein
LLVIFDKQQTANTLKDARDQYLEAIANGIQQLGVPLVTFLASTEIAERIDSVPVAELASMSPHYIPSPFVVQSMSQFDW